MEKIAIIHYHEIALKGKNRDFFEFALIKNLKKSLTEKNYEKIERLYGRVVVFLKDGFAKDEVSERIKNVFGVANFSFGYFGSLNLKELADQIFDHLPNKNPVSFRVTAKRSDKSYPKNSQQISAELGSFLIEKFEKKTKVDLKNPELNCFVEILSKETIFYFHKQKAYGGLPVGTSGKVVSLLSSGFDSPVASWKMMRRGAKVVFVHFHSYPYTKKTSYENVKKITSELNKYQFESKVYFVPFSEIQKEISTKCDSSQRVILYRRFMMRIAEKIAQDERAKALVAGDSLAQVASQTLDNIFVISEAVKIPILRPLIGENKEDIIELSKKIGTYEFSSQPYEDCCSLFLPKFPETHANLAKIVEMEKKLDILSMVSGAINKMEIWEIKNSVNC